MAGLGVNSLSSCGSWKEIEHGGTIAFNQWIGFDFLSGPGGLDGVFSSCIRTSLKVRRREHPSFVMMDG